MSRMPLTKRERKKRRLNIICYFLLIIPLFIISFPLLVCLACSFKDGAMIFVDKGIIPENPTLANYIYVLGNFEFLDYMKNSAIISACSMFFCVIIGSLTAYSLSRFRGKVFNFVKLMTYVLQMIPVGLVFLPMYMVIKKLGLYDTQAAVVLLYTGLNLCLTIWIMKGFFDTIPYEIEESAFIDGCGHLRSYISIIMPLAGPGIACCCILTFMNTYNEVAIASLFMKSKDIQPITLGLQTFVQQFTNADSWGYIFAGSVLATLPAVLIVFLAQKYIIAGLSGAGSLKG